MHVFYVLQDTLCVCNCIMYSTECVVCIIKYKYMYTSTQVHEYTSAQVQKYTSTQVHKYTSTQVQASSVVCDQVLAVALLAPDVYRG